VEPLTSLSTETVPVEPTSETPVEPTSETPVESSQSSKECSGEMTDGIPDEERCIDIYSECGFEGEHAEICGES
jgi:hypothetical protein